MEKLITFNSLQNFRTEWATTGKDYIAV